MRKFMQMKATQLLEAVAVLKAPKLTEKLGISSQRILIQDVKLLTNPSIVRSKTGWLIAVRAPNHRLGSNGNYVVRGGFGRIKSDTYLIELNEKLDRIKSYRLDDSIAVKSFPPGANGFEDPRLFWNDGELMCLWSALRLGERASGLIAADPDAEVASRPDWNGAETTMALASVSAKTPISPVALPSPDGSLREKNWMPFVCDGCVHFIYYLDKMRVYRLLETGLKEVNCFSMADPRLKSWSGSSQVVEWEGNWLCVAHLAGRSLKTDRFRLEPFYFHRLVLFSPKWEVLALSSPFFFERKGIEFCAGIAVDEDRVIFSYGIRDSEAALLEVSRAAVNKLLGLWCR